MSGRKDAPVRVPPQDGSILVEQARGHDDRSGNFAQLRARGLAGQGSLPELRRRVRREHDVLREALPPVDGVEVERGDFERGGFCLERAVRAPDLEHSLKGEERRGLVVRVCLLLLARHADGVWPQLALDGEVCRLGAEEVVHDRPRSHRPAVIDLSCES